MHTGPQFYLQNQNFGLHKQNFVSGFRDGDYIAFSHSDKETTNHILFYSLRSELLFVTSAHGSFDNTGGTLTHRDSDVSINIEPGTFPDGNQQPIFFHVIYNDTYVIRDIPERNERTLISPVIKCGPDDINPQKAMEIVVPHCLYIDEVKKGSIAVYRCEQFTNEGRLSCCRKSH